MDEIKEKIRHIFGENSQSAFIYLKHCNFEQAIQNFLGKNGIEVSKEDIITGEKESYIDPNGVFRYKKNVKIKPQELKLLISCCFEKEWGFYFEKELAAHEEIQKERVIGLGEKDFVIVSCKDDNLETVLFTVPLSIAEELDLEEFHEKDLKVKEKEYIWNKIEQFRVQSMIQLK